MAKKKTSPSSAAASEDVKTPATRRRSASATSSPSRVRATAQATTAQATTAPATEPSYDEIAEAAYHRYLSRGGSHGRDFDDWVEAERDLRLRGR